MRVRSEARVISAPLTCALKVPATESKRRLRSSPAVANHSAPGAVNALSKRDDNAPAMNSAAMKGIRSARAVMRAGRNVPGSTLTNAASFGARSRRAPRETCRSVNSNSKPLGTRARRTCTVK
jgi:hypothetical protein